MTNPGDGTVRCPECGNQNIVSHEIVKTKADSLRAIADDREERGMEDRAEAYRNAAAAVEDLVE